MKVNKTRIRASQKKVFAATFTIFLILFMAASLLWVYYSPGQTENPLINPSSEPTAAIVDQLSLTYPNQTFIQTATNLLKNAGYRVDYIPGENVTVNYYRSLSAYNYKIVILRVHAALSVEMHAIAFFTSETYSESKYTVDQLAFYLGQAIFPNDEDHSYFAITANFVKNAMKGNFNDTTVIMMGCYGLEYPDMASAFMEKGALTYIGWNGSVSADHTDETTLNLLKQLILDKQPIGQAIETTMNENGPDPIDNSILTYYPNGVREQKIQYTDAAAASVLQQLETWISVATKKPSESFLDVIQCKGIAKTIRQNS